MFTYTFVFDYWDNFFRCTELIYAKLDFGEVRRLCRTYLEVRTAVLLADAGFEFELLVECKAGLLTSILLGIVVASYFFVTLAFLTSGFLNKAPVDVALLNVIFYFFLESGFYVLFI